MIKANLYNTNIKQSQNLYLEKSTKKDYLSKFFSYDKHKIKKKAFFYIRLINLKNKEKQKNKIKFSYFETQEEENVNPFHKVLINKTSWNRLNLSQSYCNLYSKSSTCTYTPYLNLGVTSHGDNYKVYGKRDWCI